MNKKYFISGIGTDVGKTVVSAIFVQAFEGAYWKPVQAGDLDNSDTMKVQRWTTDEISILQEAYRLNEPMSPHAAAALDNVEISVDSIRIPATEKTLIVEGAGGIMVPLNENGVVYADWVENKELPVIIVSRHYLGSINHTLLTIELLKQRHINIVGLVYVGDENKATESIIEKHSGIPKIIRIPLVDEVNESFIKEQADLLRQTPFYING